MGSQKTPKEDLDLAKKRRNEVLQGDIEDEKQSNRQFVR